VLAVGHHQLGLLPWHKPPVTPLFIGVFATKKNCKTALRTDDDYVNDSE